MQTGLLKAEALSGLGKSGELIEEYRSILEKDNSLLRVYLRLARLLEQSGNRAEAKTTYQTALRIHPEYGIAANNLAWLVLNDDEPDLDKALRLALLAQNYNTDAPHINDTLGWVLYKKREFARAQNYLKIAVSKLPDNPTVRYHYALNLIGLKKTGPGLAELKKCLASTAPFPEREEAQQVLDSHN